MLAVCNTVLHLRQQRFLLLQQLCHPPFGVALASAISDRGEDE